MYQIYPLPRTYAYTWYEYTLHFYQKGEPRPLILMKIRNLLTFSELSQLIHWVKHTFKVPLLGNCFLPHHSPKCVMNEFFGEEIMFCCHDTTLFVLLVNPQNSKSLM